MTSINSAKPDLGVDLLAKECQSEILNLYIVKVSYAVTWCAYPMPNTGQHRIHDTCEEIVYKKKNIYKYTPNTMRCVICPLKRSIYAFNCGWSNVYHILLIWADFIWFFKLHDKLHIDIFTSYQPFHPVHIHTVSMELYIFVFKGIASRFFFHKISGRSTGGLGGSLELPPCPQFLNILWKWNNLVSVRPNYFIFVGY